MNKTLWLLCSILLTFVLFFGSLNCTAPASSVTTSTSVAPTTEASTEQATQFILKGQNQTAKGHITEVPIEAFMAEVERRSNGRVKFERNYSSTLVPTQDSFDAVGKGRLDYMISTAAYWSDAIPEFALDNAPFVTFNVSEAIYLRNFTDVGKIMDKASIEKGNAKIVFFSPQDALPIATTKKPIKTLDDLKGLKLRAPPGLPTDLFKALGASTVSIATNELGPAVQTGVIDGVTLQYVSLIQFGIMDLTKYVTEPGLTGTVGMTFFINYDLWKKFPADLQQMIESVGREYGSYTIWNFERDLIKSKQRFLDKGVQIYTLPIEEQQKWLNTGGLKIWEDITKRLGEPNGSYVMSVMRQIRGLK